MRDDSGRGAQTTHHKDERQPAPATAFPDVGVNSIHLFAYYVGLIAHGFMSIIFLRVRRRITIDFQLGPMLSSGAQAHLNRPMHRSGAGRKNYKSSEKIGSRKPENDIIFGKDK